MLRKALTIRPVIVIAKEDGNAKVVQALLDAGADPDVQIRNVELADAIRNGNAAMVQALLDAEADPNAEERPFRCGHQI